MKNSRTKKRPSAASTPQMTPRTTARRSAAGVNARQTGSEGPRRPISQNPRKNMTAAEVAEELDVPLARVYAMVREGSPDAPPHFKVGKSVRFPRAEFRTWRAARIVGSVDSNVTEMDHEEQADGPKRLLRSR